ncbi:preprotein translocase subunit SecG [Caulobacter hibisci]|uniref:Protein-export membrane protein SecG n=1 Tax=Caulobacter hibisci TaxID=2035993 RepID=A0ABS0SYI7_9CAUL|nr:preprotein translocase subunit SecG [Caulobacter hibisci]MBI1683743.1 preprotein translocase subunit SecG [Caulobacter hibisci]
MLIGILLTINIIVCVVLIGFVLLQRSEGGALGMGGGGAGNFMTARGAGDFMTRMTWILFSVFIVVSLILTVLTGRLGGSDSVVDKLKIDNLDTKTLNAPATPAVPAPTTPAPIQAPTPQLGAPTVPAPATAPAQTPAQ